MYKNFILAVALILLSVSSVVLAAPVNVNTATAEEISENLVGIGLKKATAIVEYRQQHGVFQTANELINVKGIGLETLEKNKSDILLQ